MNQRKFYTRFPSEESCKRYLKEKLEQGIIKCPKCNNINPKWSTKHLLWRCKCMHRISVKSITFMKDSNISLLKWFEAIYLFVNTKKPMSDLEFSRKLEINRYQTAHYLLLKIRKQMSKKLDAINFDNMTMINLTDDVHCNMLIKKSIDRKSDQIKLNLPPKFMEVYTFLHSPNYSMKKIIQSTPCKHPKLPVISRIKQKWKNVLQTNYTKILNGIHHGITNFHIQLYLDEYSYKYNHRFMKNQFSYFMNLDVNWQNSV